MIEQVAGKIELKIMRDALLKGNTISIPSLDIKFELSEEQWDLLNVMDSDSHLDDSLRDWFTFKEKNEDDLYFLMQLGFLERKPSWGESFDYRRVA